MEQGKRTSDNRTENQARKVGNTAKKGFLRIVFSRAGIIIFLVLLQFVFFATWATVLSNYQGYVYALVTFAGICVLIFIYNSSSVPEFKMTWILFVMIFPVFATLFYIYVRTQLGVRRMRQRLIALNEEMAPYLQQDEAVVDALRSNRPSDANLSHFLSDQVHFPTYRNTEVIYYPLGEDFYDALMAELKKAHKFIFMEYFIIEEGYMWDSVLDLLKEKAAEGVEVRLLYDGMCEINRVPFNYYKKIEKYGIKCHASNPVRPFLSTIQNNRDHRKICVIDGQVAFTGGVNLADEYMNQISMFGHWKDTAILLRGDATESFTMMFLQMWNVSNRKEEDFSPYTTEKRQNLHPEWGYVIPYGDSPFDDANVGEEVYLHILNHAKEYVHLMTPYLILDHEMLQTIERVAESGIDVAILLPHIPDKWYTFLVAKTYYKELIQAGVKIYEYTPGFVHAKVAVSDDDTATVGSVNLDYRSLYLHFECGAFIYDNPVVKTIEEDFQQTLEKSQLITLRDVQKRGNLNKLAGQVLRLIAPLL